MEEKIKGELLAPAGNFESALAALTHGADAVYAGFSQFNAREMNQNFSFEEMSKLSQWCKTHGKKYYNTFNTLIKEEEMEAFFQTVKKAVALEPDGLILQDIGVAKLIKEAFPHQKIHASTQMGIHNSLGVEWAKKNGFSRVILERQINKEELAAIASKASIELEVFIHGAICCSLSGCCLFSSWIGGYSGNRGKCKQPCRRRYYPERDEKKKISKVTNGFFFSTADLCMVDKMQELLDLGIASFKIEGRLKRPDYVIATVKAYRKLIDQANQIDSKTINEAKQILSASPSRIWSHGFYDGVKEEKLIQSSRLGVAGKLCGEILQISEGKIKIKASAFIKKGDRLRFQSFSGNEMPSFTLLKYHNLTRKGAPSIKEGEEALLFTDIVPEKESKLFLIGTALTLSLPPIEKLPLYAPNYLIQMDVELTQTNLLVRAKIDRNGEWEENFSFHLESAQNSRIDSSTIQKIFSQSANPRYQTTEIKCKINGDWFMPLSLLKEIRRNFWNHLIEFNEKSEKETASKKNTFSLSCFKNELKQKASLFSKEPYQGNQVFLAVKASDWKNYRRFYPKAEPLFPIDDYREDLKGKKIQWILPPFVDEKKLDDFIFLWKKMIQEGEYHFRITSLFQLALIESFTDFFEKNQIKLHLTIQYPFPITNSIALLYLLTKVDRVQLWVELSYDEQKKLLAGVGKEFENRLEQYQAGYPSILTTRADVPFEGKMKDSHGLAFSVSKEKGMTMVFSQKLFFADAKSGKGLSEYYDFRNGKIDNEEKSSFNFHYQWN